MDYEWVYRQNRIGGDEAALTPYLKYMNEMRNLDRFNLKIRPFYSIYLTTFNVLFSHLMYVADREWAGNTNFMSLL
jgi:hypothetical protein